MCCERTCSVMSYKICYLDAAWQQHVVGAGVGMNKPKFECLECNPPRTFRSVSGYNGHMQFKHDKTGVFSGRPPSKQTEMIQQLLDQQEHLLNQQQALYALIAERSDNRIGVFSGGNGNDNPGNNHEGNNNDNPGNGSGNVDQGEEQGYYCESRGFLGIGSLCGANVELGDKECGTCGSELNWAAMSR